MFGVDEAKEAKEMRQLEQSTFSDPEATKKILEDFLAAHLHTIADLQKSNPPKELVQDNVQSYTLATKVIDLILSEGGPSLSTGVVASTLLFICTVLGSIPQSSKQVAFIADQLMKCGRFLGMTSMQMAIAEKLTDDPKPTTN